MYSLFIALRFLISSKFQTILIILGIAIGVSVQIFIGQLIMGLQANLIDNTVGSSPHIVISNNDDNAVYFDEDIEVNNLNDSEISAVSNTIDVPSLAVSSENSFSVLIKGVNFEDANVIYKLDDKLIAGNIANNNNEIIIGKNLFEKLQLKIGESIDIRSSSGEVSRFIVSGVFDFGNDNINDSWIFGELKNIQSNFGYENKLSAIELQVEQVFEAQNISKTIETDLNVISWQESNEQLLSALSSQSLSSYIIQVFVMISVVLAIASVLIISVVQKQKQIGILKAMGVTDNIASKIFILQGLILGILGATLGVVFGLSLLLMFSKFAVDANSNPVIPLSIQYKYIILSYFIALLAAVSASIIPSISSRKFTPIEVIKNG